MVLCKGEERKGFTLHQVERDGCTAGGQVVLVFPHTDRMRAYDMH